MSGLDMATVAIGTVNLLSCLCRLDPMTLATHRLWPQVLFVGVALAAIVASAMAAYSVASEAAVVAQLCASIVLLHTLPAWRQGPPEQAWRDSVLLLRRNLKGNP